MRVVRFWVGAAMAAGSLLLAGCSHVPDAVNPGAWYRSATGENNAQDANQRNAQNLEAGSKEPYPNLSTVPNVPSSATSTVDRAKLVHSLIADRTNAKYNNEQLEAGRQLASIAPPPAPVKLGPPGASSTAPVNAPAPSAPPATTAVPAKAAAPPSGANARGGEEPPQESTLTSPTIPSVPKGEAPPPPPAPAKVASTPPPATPSVAPVTPGAPPPAAPHLTPPPAAPANVRGGGQPSLAMRTPATAPNPISVSVGDVAFAAGSSDLAETQRSALAEIAGLYKQTGGQIRIVGHAEPGQSSDAIRQRIAGLDLALDRANAVAQALARLGVPARDMRVEAAPASAAEQPRAEVFMDY